ncbi:MAG: phytanoyl-CoA dioxygenase family protein, partial [Acidobacteriota bacterium]|nr:phytanoyl-CoA dioxygenase family protein [Acidobacteriota bacterium]
MNANHTALAAQLDQRGYCLLPGVLPPGELDDLRRSVARDVRAHTDIPMPVGHVPGFLRVNQALAPFLAHPRVLGLARSLLGSHVRISMLTGSVNGPGIPRGAFHADWPYNQKSAACIPAPYPDLLMHLVTFWMLTDFTEENGATIVVPGSHRKPNHPMTGGPVAPAAPPPAAARRGGWAGTVAGGGARR